MKISELLSKAILDLGSHTESTREAILLLTHVCNIDKASIIAWPDQVIAKDQCNIFTNLIRRRVQGEPIAYLLGHQSFWSTKILVSKDVLIPRIDTEFLVEQALQYIPNNPDCRVLDLGTGSGAISIAIAKERPKISILATDISRAALAIAKLNIENLQIHNIDLFHGSWFEALANANNAYFDVIISNPPYIAEQDVHLERGDLKFEPQSALVAKQQGLADIIKIATQAGKYLKKSGWLIIEHGYNQQHLVIEIFRQNNFKQVQGFNDLANQPRVVLGCK